MMLYKMEIILSNGVYLNLNLESETKGTCANLLTRYNKMSFLSNVGINMLDC